MESGDGSDGEGDGEQEQPGANDPEGGGRRIVDEAPWERAEEVVTFVGEDEKVHGGVGRCEQKRLPKVAAVERADSVQRAEVNDAEEELGEIKQEDALVEEFAVGEWKDEAIAGVEEYRKAHTAENDGRRGGEEEATRDGAR